MTQHHFSTNTSTNYFTSDPRDLILSTHDALEITGGLSLVFGICWNWKTVAMKKMCRSCSRSFPIHQSRKSLVYLNFVPRLVQPMAQWSILTWEAGCWLWPWFQNLSLFGVLGILTSSWTAIAAYLVVKLTAFSHFQQMHACCTGTKIRWHEEQTPGSSCKDNYRTWILKITYIFLWSRPLPRNPLICTSIQLPLGFCQ